MKKKEKVEKTMTNEQNMKIINEPREKIKIITGEYFRMTLYGNTQHREKNREGNTLEKNRNGIK